jgi:hypothetical protein
LVPVIVALAVLGSIARAGTTTSISIAGDVNSNVRTYTDGNNYPIAPVVNTVDGVPFQLVPLSKSANSLGVIQTPDGKTSSFTIPAGVAGVTKVFTLINSTFGQAGIDVGSIEFKGMKGSDVTFQLVEGNNIRDHFQNVFENSATNVFKNPYLNGVQNPSGPDRLDMQTFTLPASFANDTLTEIIFKGLGKGTQGDPFMAAVTVETTSVAVPEPATLTLGATVLGATVLGGLARRLRRREAA